MSQASLKLKKFSFYIGIAMEGWNCRAFVISSTKSLGNLHSILFTLLILRKVRVATEKHVYTKQQFEFDHI